ncbi:MAG: hypothetical protein JWO02_2986 [Solirubrobacterales bacterium]|nr:hypothetical protein [Solirubrobacterales bacterium]
MTLDDDDLPTADVDRLADRRREERRAVEEGGGGVSEGFEQAEEQLIEHTSHGDEHGTGKITQDSRDEAEAVDETYGEPDTEIVEDS